MLPEPWDLDGIDRELEEFIEDDFVRHGLGRGASRSVFA